MKRLAALLAGIVVSQVLTGCDGSTGPTTVTVHDTLRIHDTLYQNDRFAGSKALVHGIWKLTTSSDTGVATLFQIGDSISATIVWKIDGTKSLKGVVSTRSSIALSDSMNNYQISGAFQDSTNHRINKISGQVLDLLKFRTPGTGKALDSLLAIRTF